MCGYIRVGAAAASYYWTDGFTHAWSVRREREGLSRRFRGGVGPADLECRPGEAGDSEEDGRRCPRVQAGLCRADALGRDNASSKSASV